MVQHLGFIGTGKIGSAMIRCMLKKGFKVRVWNRTKSKALLLAKEGAVIEKSTGDIFRKERIIFLSLGDGKDVNKVVSKGRPAKGTLIINTSTVDPADTKKIEGLARKRGLEYVEAPVFNAPAQVEKGETLFVVGGNKKAKKIAKSFLAHVALDVVDAGKAEQAAAVKIAYNLLHGIIVAGTVESMVFAKKLGINPELMREIISKGNVNCGSVVRASNAVFKKDKKLATFSLKYRLKDSKIASECAKRKKQKLPVHGAATKQYEEGVKRGFGDESVAAIWQLYQ